MVTKQLPGERWRQLLADAGCRVEVCTAPDPILSTDSIKALIGDKCDAAIGQLTEASSAQHSAGLGREQGAGG